MKRGQKTLSFKERRAARIKELQEHPERSPPMGPWVKNVRHTPFHKYKEAAWTILRDDALRQIARWLDTGAEIFYMRVAGEWGIEVTYLYSLVSRIRRGEIPVPVDVFNGCECDSEGPGLKCLQRNQWHGFRK